MTYKQIEASREVRLWISQVIVPACTMAMLIPDVRNKVLEKASNMSNSIKEKFKKEP